MLISVGKIIKAQGIKGEVKVSCFLDGLKQLSAIKTLYLSDIPYSVRTCRFQGDYAYLSFVGVTDRNTAETLVNTELFADKDEVPVEKGRYFVSEVIGCKVFSDSGLYLGEITDVYQNGRVDVFFVNGKKNLQFPFLQDLVVSLDVDAKKMIVKDKRLQEVCLYED